MGHRRAARRGDEARDAGIAEEIENPRTRRPFGERVRQPRPVGGLFRKDSEMAKGRQARFESDVAPRHGPGLGRRTTAKTPASLIILVRALEHGVGHVPAHLVQGWRPQALGLGPDDLDGAVAFKLAPAASVVERIVIPGGRA